MIATVTPCQVLPQRANGIVELELENVHFVTVHPPHPQRRHLLGAAARGHLAARGGAGGGGAALRRRRGAAPRARGLHSSTFRLNLSALCGIGVTFRGYLGGV